jgi:ABC-2 type transport system ATP-binding protein
VQSSLIVRSTAPIDDPTWTTDPMGLEDVVLAYMTEAAGAGRERTLENQR